MAKKIAYIQAAWHQEMNQIARDAFGKKIGDKVTVEDFVVPGALEMPLKAQQCARTGEFDAVICGAFVIDGGIYRHDFVAQAVLDGIMRVSLDESLPVLSLSLTPHQFHEHSVHQEFYEAHMIKKGEEAAEAIQMLFDL